MGTGIGARLTYVRKINGLNTNQLAEKIGVTPSVIRNYLSERTEVPPYILARIVDVFGVDRVWITSGIGSGPAGASEAKINPPRIPYYDVDVMATPIEVFNDDTISPAYHIEMPGFTDCDFAISVFGHSMYPTIESGMIVLCKKLHDPTVIAYGEVYFIVTNDFRMVKRLIKSDKPGYIIAASDNHNGHASPDGKTYAPIELPVEKILHLYLVKESFKRHMI